MYNPPAFALTDPADIHRFIAGAGLAQLVTMTVEGLMCSPLPLLFDPDDGEHGSLTGHLARANPQWRLPPQAEALVIFTGASAYVSPNYYPGKTEHHKVVPTWNYETVQAHGRVEFFEDQDRLLELVCRLTDHHESGSSDPWSVNDAPPDFIKAQLRGIVGMKLSITRLEGKRKMSQNRPVADREGVRAGLAASGKTGDREAAGVMGYEDSNFNKFFE